MESEVKTAMAKDLKKFVNLKFLRTVNLGLLRRLFERQPEERRGLDLALFDQDEVAAREAIQAFFAGPEDRYPAGVVADLHRIAELGDQNGLRLLQEQAQRRLIDFVRPPAEGEEAPPLDPKHVALLAFLDHEAVFNAASDLMALEARTSLAEFAGADEDVEPRLDDASKAAFEAAAGEMFRRDLNGGYCRVGWYEDDDEINVVVTHGAPVTVVPVIDGDREHVISYRSAEQAVLAYTPLTGRLKVGGVAKAQQATLAETFAQTMLNRPGFFAGDGSRNLYTLAPIERAGLDFTIDHAFDPGIQRVQIVEVQIDRINTDAQTGEVFTLWSLVARSTRRDQSALGALQTAARGIVFGPDAYRVGHVVLRIHVAVDRGRPVTVTVKIKPPTSAVFKRQRFEARVMELLRRNGFCHEREPAEAAVAAE